MVTVDLGPGPRRLVWWAFGDPVTRSELRVGEARASEAAIERMMQYSRRKLLAMLAGRCVWERLQSLGIPRKECLSRSLGFLRSLKRCLWETCWGPYRAWHIFAPRYGFGIYTGVRICVGRSRRRRRWILAAQLRLQPGALCRESQV